MKLERRQYEDAAVRALRADLKKHKRVIAVSPTGSGKTVIAALLVKREPRWKRVLFLAHRYELIDQAFDKLTGLGLDVGVMMAQDEVLHGDERVRPEARVQIGSVQTVDRRGVPPGVHLIIFDEAHRAMADSYQRIAKACPRAEVLGLTATPCRLDGKGLGDFFKHMLVVAKPSELHEGGYLAKPRTFSSTSDVLAKLTEVLEDVRTVKGDYAPEALGRAVERRFLVGKVVTESIRLAPKVPKVVFACNVRHSKRIVAGFVAAGINAVHLDGETRADVRRDALADLSAGRIEVISNVDVLSEGWDLPALGAVVIARPTKSIARFLQMCGRGLRPWKGRVPIILDHGDNVRRLDVLPGADIEWSLTDGIEPMGDGDPKVKQCASCLAMMAYGETECPECGEEQPKTECQLRVEAEAELVEITATRMAAMRARLEVLARAKCAPAGWVASVVEGGV